MMAGVVCVGLLLGWAACRERLRRQTGRVLNQDITVRSAEANYLNAGLAREAAQAAIAQYAEGDGNPKVIVLRAAARRARQRELELKEVWELEKGTLSRLITELHDSWP
jgi:hypothetical protein